ncbi:prepilin-type N-terminal cleavage/methylation domain-containing protein [Acidithiobacillus thiooxidans]|uniref:Pilus assembly protein PilW n=1 Tax=Acidithiobacillus thiooxidans TaxID=930 RepID=A0A1C2ICF6_ACITH|nr:MULTISPECIES: PilW family protein [Acidithiobacillus]MBE7567268.1 PilW family protein [Acidithiobacillus sp. HP-11]MBU2749967.1 prepilin-type N-terminal cleavage/methylation domain-containing protein [Acidithiobacillus thiooxidans]MBU2791976.1 prepilin-type N-terminal cleavage/methylation domain-containing protein [Acidithiobacillus thiooxidans]OCX69189.1 pilus assembly protein PilW [Acidithiobacillus thiooxidans]OCX71213.1 pilus assembly protein PilW [Acidithiobacillus thiooxidans]
MRQADVSETGFTLTELLIALVISTLLAAAVFTFFLNSSQIITNQSSTTDMWQRGRNALAIVRQAVESAGFGLPQASDCPNGIAAYNSNQTSSSFSLMAITASVQSSGTYDPTSMSNINTYSLMTVAGGASFGNAPVGTITKTPNSTSATVFLSNVNLVQPNDMFIIDLPGQACLMGQVTNVNPQGKGQNGNNIEYNHGLSPFNPSQGLSGIAGTTYNISGMSFVGANFLDLGSNYFTINQFSIGDNGGTATPTLYLTQYTANQTTKPVRQALARGIVDLQLEYGLGSNSAISQWVLPNKYTPTPTLQILAVKISLLARSTRYMPNEISPATFAMPTPPGQAQQTYTVPQTNGPGCLQGNCRHYAYHLFESVVPVRNNIWGGS